MNENKTTFKNFLTKSCNMDCSNFIKNTFFVVGIIFFIVSIFGNFGHRDMGKNKYQNDNRKEERGGRNYQNQNYGERGQMNMDNQNMKEDNQVKMMMQKEPGMGPQTQGSINNQLVNTISEEGSVKINQ